MRVMRSIYPSLAAQPIQGDYLLLQQIYQFTYIHLSHELF